MDELCDMDMPTKETWAQAIWEKINRLQLELKFVEGRIKALKGIDGAIWLHELELLRAKRETLLNELETARGISSAMKRG